MMKIDPQGELANIIRFSLTDAYLTVPDFVLQMFPETANFTNKRYGFTLNLGTLITMLQSTAQFMQPVIEKSEAFINDSDKNLNDWMASLPQTFSPWEWIALLPPELRKFRTGGSIAGFDASACLVIATDEEAKKSFTTRNTRERKTLEPMQIQESDSIGVIRFTKDSTPKYKPTSCYDFQNVWIAEGIDGEWECHDKMISQQKKLSGIAYLIYQKEIPENIAISIQLDALLKSERESIGLVFCYQNKNNYYLLRISIDENNQTSIVLERKKSGHFLPEPLVNKPIGKTAQVSETFELLTYLEKDRRVMILNRSISYRDRTDTTSSKKVQTKQIAHVSDESSLENGKVGLYAKYLEKASFEEMTITELKIEKIKNKEIEADSFNNGYKLNYRHSELNHHRLVEKNESDVLFKGKEFKKFDESFLDKLPIGRLLNTNESTGSIFIGAHINVFEAQKYRFFGKLYQNGSFALISENETKPIRLKVLGIDATLPFKGYSNFILAGKQKRDGYDGYLEADGYSDWSPVPNIVRIEIGRKDDLASLKLYSKGTFAITANTKITLFNGEGIIKGTVDISNSHIMFDGTLKYTLGKSLISSGNSYKFQDILSLDIKGKGGLADLGRYYYTGHGTVKFLGIQQAKTDVEINNHYASFRLKFQKDKNSSSALLNKFNVLKDATILLDAEAKVNIRRTVRPEFELNGNGSISLYGATINGSGSVISRPSKSKRLKDDFFELKMQGDLLWHGRKWLGGAMKIGSKGFEVSGSTQFNIDIKLDNNTGIEIPQLFFEINLDGQLSLDAYGKNPKFAYSGHWAIGIKLPDNGNNDNRQIFYLATNTFKFSQKNKLDVSDEYGIKILDVNGFNYLPFGDIEIPVPNINAPERRKALVTYGYTNSKKDDNGNTVGTGPLAIAFPVAPNMPGLQFPRSSNPFDLNNIENLLPKLLLNENYEKDMDKRVKGIYFDYKNIFSPADYKISFNTIQLSDFEIYLMIDNAVAEGFPLKLQIRYGNNHEQHQDIVFNK